MIFPPNVDVPEEYHVLAEAINEIHCELEKIYQDRSDLDEYDLPEGMYWRLQRAIDARVRELIAEKARYELRQIEIEHELLGDIPD